MMEIQTVKETIETVVCEVLEQMAFMFPEPAGGADEIAWDEFEFVAASVSFSGDCEGESLMIAPMPFCVELSANMLGEEIDPANPKEKHCDALKEVLNIVTGQLLTQCFSDKAIFNLSAPRAESVSVAKVRELAGKSDSSCSMVDSYPIVSRFTVKGS
ncbi:MAG: chemotaxis protein CheX [Candidatus Zixiibacteriota bacterium]